jgi:hypothetical protein
LADLYLSDTAFANRDEEGADLELRVGDGIAGTALEFERLHASGTISERAATAVSGVNSSSVGSGTDELNFDIVRSRGPPVGSRKRQGDRLLNTCSGRGTYRKDALVCTDGFGAGNEDRVGYGGYGGAGAAGSTAFEGHDSLRRVATCTIGVSDRRNISVYYRLEDRHFIILKILFSFKIWKKNQLI